MMTTYIFNFIFKSKYFWEYFEFNDSYNFKIFKVRYLLDELNRGPLILDPSPVC